MQLAAGVPEGAAPPVLRPRGMKVGVDEVSADREHARHLAHPRAEILDVADHQRCVDEIERRRRERKAARVGAHPPRARAAREHRDREVDADDHPRAAGAQHRHVASRPGADVERARRAHLREQRLDDRLLHPHQRIVRSGRIGGGPQVVCGARLERRGLHQNPVVSGRWYRMR